MNDKYWAILGITGDKVFASGTAIVPGANADVRLYDSRAGGRGAHLGARWKHITVNIFADQASAANGVSLLDCNDPGAETVHYELSIDTDGNAVQFTTVANTYFKKELSVSAPDFAIRYVHGATPATVFRWAILGDPLIP